MLTHELWPFLLGIFKRLFLPALHQKLLGACADQVAEGPCVGFWAAAIPSLNNEVRPPLMILCIKIRVWELQQLGDQIFTAPVKETTGPKYVSQNGRTANWCHRSKIFFWASEQDSWRTGLLRELNPWILKESGLLRAEALLREVLCRTNRCSDWYKFGDSLWPSLLLNFSRATVICLASSSMS